MNNLRSKRQSSQRGTSLVEVLVALVLLVVGIYSIARLFPGGFFSLRSAENDTFADRLAQGQLEQLKQNNNFLLDAVYMYSNQVGFFSDSSTVDPFSADTYTPPGGTAADASLANVDRARYISGESFVVPAPNTANTVTNGTSVHVLNDGPVVLVGGALAEPPPLPASPSPVVKSPVGVFGPSPVHSAPWTATAGTAPQTYNAGVDVPGSFDQPSDLLAPGQPDYAVDYNGEQIALAPEPYDQRFTLQIRLLYPATGTGASATPAETVTFYVPLLLPSSTSGTGSYQGQWFNPMTTGLDSNRPVVTDLPVPTLPPGTSPTWATGSTVLTRTLTPVSGGIPALKSGYTAVNTDPYTYVVYSSDTTLTSVNLGVLALNPRLQGQTVSVSYLVYDWHIIREDEDVPVTTSDTGAVVPGTQSPIHLTLDHLRRVGDVLDNQTTYPGLFRSVGTAPTNDATVGYDIVLLDTDTGQSIGLTAPAIGTTGASVFDLDNPNGSTVAPGQFAVSYQNGYITLPSGMGSTTPSTNAWTQTTHQHVRIFYKADYDWAVALQKSPSIYARNDSGLPPPGTTSYSLLPGQYAISGSSGAYDIYLPNCDAGQSIELNDITYYDTSGKQYQLSNLTLSVATIDPTLPVNYLDTTNPLTGVPITGVRMGGDAFVNLGASLPVDSGATLDTTGLPRTITPPKSIMYPRITIGAVQSISARSIVVWKERGQWKSREVSTILNQ